MVLAAAADPRCPWVAHNAAFERAMLECILIPQHGWPMVPVDRHVCTMSLALAHAYPGSLEGVAEILGLVNQKDIAREKIVRVMWKPRKPRRGEDPTQIYWVDTPELRAELYIYNRQDVAVERELHQHPKLQALPASEQDTWVLDAEINDHGVRIDAPLATAASALAAQALADLNERMRQETDGAVDKATKTGEAEGVAGVAGRQASAPAEEAEIRTAMGRPVSRPTTSRSSWPETCRTRACVQRSRSGCRRRNRRPAKWTGCCETRCADGRVRNLYRIYGAVTGRWSGEGFQPQNLKRPELLQTDEAIAEAIAMVMAGDYAAIKERYGDVLGVIGDLCRSMLIPAPGHRFIVGDFSAIEARVLAFLAGDADKLESFPPIRSRPRAGHLLRHGRAGSRPHRRAGQIAGAAAREDLRARAGVLDGGRQAAGHDPEGQHPQHCVRSPRERPRAGCKNGAPRIPRSSHTGPRSMPPRWRRCATQK